MHRVRNNRTPSTVAADKPLKELDSFKPGQSPDAQRDLTVDKSVRLSYMLSDRKGTALLEYRQVDAKAYLRADAKGLVKLAGQDPSQVDAVGKDLPAEPAPVRDVLAGKWITFDLQAAADEAKKSDGTKAVSPSAKPSLDPETAKQLTNSVKDVLTRTVTFEDKGEKDGTEHVWISAPGRRLADELLKAVRPLAAKLPEKFGKLPDAVPAGVRETAVGADLYLKDGKPASVTFDLAQLEKKAGPGVNFPVKLAFSQSTPTVEAPAGTVALTGDDLQRVVPNLTRADGLGTGRGGSAGPGAAPAPGKPLTGAQSEERSASG
ncbi:hypothetical protein ACFV4F_42540 [Kitasatospora sp. NPDC059722]|uniref:hypothetical protein n=1 Tax=Kitasatospora sp. NPDC059722 TaxID=3346925 RepID=UPI0036921915